MLLLFHFEFLSCLSFLTENSNTIIITAYAQNMSVWTAIRVLVSRSVLDNVTAWLRWIKCQVNAFSHYINFFYIAC